MVMMDREDYIHKAKNLLEQLSTYRPTPTGLTKTKNKKKAKQINILKRIKVET